ncbi:hypothetical protein ACPEEZ_00625 [Frigoribacterium sp. 2-23]|uniref:hypothetical protein n=1 Tax=Frigoribacterium sp. 2-23 TaxID=3415006 RepID=UPI003C6F00DA
MKFLTTSPGRTALASAVSVALLGSILVASPASAAGFGDNESRVESIIDANAPVPTEDITVDPAVFLEGLEQLEAAPVQRQPILDDGHTYYRYTVEAGSLTLPSAADVRAAIEETEATKTITPRLQARFSGMRMAVGFNTVDQQALAAGGGAAVAAAICLIPGVGWGACAAIGVVVSVATTYIVRNGICRGGRTLWWYDVKGGSTVACRSSAPF